MSTKERFALHREGGLIFQLHIHIRSGINDRLIENRHRTHSIIHGIIHILNQCRTACSHHNTSARDIHRIQADFITRRAFVFTHQSKFIFLRHLLRHD